MQKFFAHFMYYTHTYVPTIPTSLYSLLIHFNGQNLTNIKQKPRKTYKSYAFMIFTPLSEISPSKA